MHITTDKDGNLDPVASVERADTLTTTLLGDGYCSRIPSLRSGTSTVLC